MRIPDRGFYFSQTPMLLMDRDGRIRDTNCALRELMGTDLAGSNGQGSDYLESRLRSRLIGEIFPPRGLARTVRSRSAAGPWKPRLDEVHIVEGGCRYHSPAFGIASLRPVEIPCIDPSIGELEGMVLNLEVLELEQDAAFRSAVRKRWTHEVMWEIYAPAYDRILPAMPFYREVVDRHLAAMRAAAAARVLDIGAGTGSVAVPLLREGCRVTAVDISRAMLEKLSSKLDGAWARNLTIIEDTAECLPHLEGGSFDGVTVLLAFFDMDDPHSALREAVRVLKAWGTLVITDPKACFNVVELTTFAERHIRDQGLYEDLGDDWVRVQSVAPALEAGIHSHRAAGPGLSPRPPWHAEQIHTILRSLGFVDLTFEDSHLGNCATITGRKPG